MKKVDHIGNLCRESKWTLFVVALLFAITPLVSLAQVTGNVDPTVEQFPVVRGFGDPNYNGTVDVSIPLMTVPGMHGLDFNISLQYLAGNGAPISQSSSWVGLGWNLQNYQITCNPTNAQEESDMYYFNTSDPAGAPDFYNLYYPEGATEFWIGGDGKGIPVNWSAIRIDPIRDPDTEKEYLSFIVYSVDGTRYVYGERLLKQSASVLVNHDKSWDGVYSSAGHNYYYVYKLTAILASDYHDGGGEEYSPGDGGTDKGGWIKLDYSGPKVYFSDNRGHDQQQVSYLQSVVTPTHSAYFELGSVSSPFIINNKMAVGKEEIYLKALDKIVLKRNGSETSVRTVTFFQSNGFDWLIYAGDDKYDWYDYLHQNGSSTWRTRLDGVEISGEDKSMSIPAYKFNYYYDDLVFNEEDSPYIVDNWGYISYMDDANKSFPDHSYVHGMLKEILYPTGGRVQFEYEPNYFQPERASQRYNADPRKAAMAGGLRLKKQIMIDPQTNQQQVYSYRYGLTNKYMKDVYGDSYPGVGFVSSDPGVTQNAVPTLSYIGGNIRNDVHYPDVRIVLPDGSYIDKCFTASCTEVAGAPANDYSWMFEDEAEVQRIHFSNATGIAGWPDFMVTRCASFIPYLFCVWEEESGCATGQYYSYQSNDIPSIDYDYPVGAFNTVSPYDDAYLDQSTVNGIAGCEARELDDCNANLVLNINSPNSRYPFASGYMKIAGIDNSWKRGYPVKEEKYSASGSLVWSQEYYYEMVLKHAQSYSVVVPGASFTGELHFTECSGQVKLTKTVEKSY